MTNTWVTTHDLALALGKTPQWIRHCCKVGRINGSPVKAQLVPGSGGAAGSQYAILVESLPEDLQRRLKDLDREPIDARSLRIDEAGLAEHNWKASVINPILAHPWGSSARRAELNRLVGTSRPGWTGKPVRLSRSTLESWVRTFEESGGRHLCLARSPRKDRQKRRVFVSRPWDKAAPFDDETKEQVREDLKQYVRSLLKSGAQRKQTFILASDKLRDMTAAHGFVPPADVPIFSIPLDFVRDEYHFLAVYRHKTDRKASEDNKPRIRRTIDGLAPMEVVVMDVHHINVLVKRERGKPATAKLLAFHDIATNRVFCELILFENKGGVRNADVITAFVNMCQHTAFGVPKTLYVDNGSEYNFVDYLADALKLNCSVIGYSGAEERERIIRAKPYNAAAKHVEGWFRQMNQQYFRHIKGWVDDDRMNPKRPELGKLPAPYDRGFDALCGEVYGHLHAYEHIPQKGNLKGRSPAEAFRMHVDTGWRATMMNPDDLLTVFTEPETRLVRKHGVEVKGKIWTCDGLMDYFGRTVTVHVPKYHGFSALRVTDEAGREIGIAEADEAFDVLDPRGAQESARRSGLRNKGLSRLDKSAPDIDVGEEIRAWGARQEPVTPNPPAGTIAVQRPGRRKGLALPPVSPSRQSRQEIEEEARAVDEARRALFSENDRKAS